MMNKLTIIGNIVKNPDLRSTPDGTSVCNFTVAVNRRKPTGGFAEGQPEADYFRVTVWRERGENCAKWLRKGSKVCVIGSVSVNTYTGNDGTTKAALEIKSADEVEFLSSALQQQTQEQPKVDQQSGFQQVETDLPF